MPILTVISQKSEYYLENNSEPYTYPETYRTPYIYCIVNNFPCIYNP